MKVHLRYLLLLLTGISLLQAQNVGIGVPVPLSKLSVAGNLSIGSSYTTVAAPTNGAIIEGDVGIGTNSPITKLHVNGNIYGGFPAACDVGRTVAGGGTVPDISTTSTAVDGGNVLLTLDGPGKVHVEADVTFQPTSATTPWVGLQVCATDGTTTICTPDNNYTMVTPSGYMTLSHNYILDLPSGGNWTFMFRIHKAGDGVTVNVHTYSLCAKFIGF